MIFDGELRQIKIYCNLFVSEPISNQLDQLELSSSEGLVIIRGPIERRLDESERGSPSGVCCLTRVQVVRRTPVKLLQRQFGYAGFLL